MFEATARLEIRDGELEAFKEQAAAIVRLMRRSGGTPLRYDWYVSEDGTACEVREAYADADALIAHQRTIAEAKRQLFRDTVAGHSMTFYVEPSPALAHGLEAMGVPYERLRLLQGLDADSRPAVFEVTARLAIRDGELEGFKRQAAEMMRLTREKDTRTLRYDWFLSADGTRCEVREGYIDPDGLLEHGHHVQATRARLFRDHAHGHDMTIYGEPSPALAALMERMAGHVAFHRYRLLAGGDGPRPRSAHSGRARAGALR
jgi:quinol monooxygenase YgiN